MQVELDDVDQKALMSQATVLHQDVGDLEIDSPEMFQMADQLLKRIKTAYSQLDTKRKSITIKLDATKKEIMDLFRPALDRCSQAEEQVKGKMMGYRREQQRIADEKQREIAEANRKEQERIRQENARREDEARKQREADEAKAQELQKQGRHAEAEQVSQAAQENLEIVQAENQVMAQTAALASAPAVKADVPKVAGVSFTKTYEVEVFNSHALFQHCALRMDLQRFYKLDQSALNKHAAEVKDQFKLPGCQLIIGERMGSRKG